MEHAIVIEGVTKTFGPKLAVSDLSLRVPVGSLCGFIGPNGAGKTTTIRMVMSIIFPDRGDLRVLGKASAIESKDRIGYLPEERGLYRKMKVGAFLGYMARLKGVDGATADRRVKEWLVRVDLADVLRKKCEELSKGMQQKVQFIASVIHEPDLLILDEVFSGLDPVNRRLMRDLIDEQHTRGCTIVFSTHAMPEAEQLCDHLFMIHRGRKVIDSDMASLLSRHDTRTIVLEPLASRTGAATADPTPWRRVEGVDAAEAQGRQVEVTLREGADPSRAIAALAAAEPVRRIEVKRVSLEDIFIQLVGGDQATLREELQAGPRAKDEATNPPAVTGAAAR
ncbi:MAG: ATP-binding cassette domain-containing protein [Phycisphaerae bacterium]|nr:ATP-binding cassette domain-containing protein [Phycisphaerae bacterium]